MRTPLWLSVALFTAFVVIGLGLMATPIRYDRQHPATTVDMTSVPEVAHPADLTVTTSTTFMAESNVGTPQASTDLPWWRNMTTTGHESGMGRPQLLAEGSWFHHDPQILTTAPMLALSWWRNEQKPANEAFGVLKIS